MMDGRDSASLSRVTEYKSHGELLLRNMFGLVLDRLGSLVFINLLHFLFVVLVDLV